MAIPSFLRTISSARLPHEQRVMLWLAGSALFVSNFDQDIFGLALPQIQASLHVPENQLGLFSGIIRLGVVAAFPLSFMADIVGRRRLLMITITAMSVTTLLTGFSQNAVQYLALQTLTRCFAYTEEMLCFVIIAEEVAYDLRGYALSRLSALGTLGGGFASILYASVNVLPHGWRDFYLIGGAGFFVLIFARRRLKETKRFEALRASRHGAARTLRDHLAPIASLVQAYPARFWGMIATTAPYAFGMSAAGPFVSKFLQEQHGFRPRDITLLYILGGGLSMIGYLYAGPLSDKLGRRTLLAITMPGTALMFALLYVAPNAWLLAPAWIAGAFFSFAAGVTLSAVGSELFPTSYRATASSARAVINVFAALAGLAAESALYTMFGNHVQAILCLLAFAPLSLIPLLLFIPETASRHLESIAPEVSLSGAVTHVDPQEILPPPR